MSLNYTIQCINASAGSGKTTLLVNQIMNKAITSGSFEQILCLTFSNAAAQELMKRVYIMNNKLDRTCIWNHQLAQTIHSFCLTLLRNHNLNYQILTPYMQNLLWNKSLNDCAEEFTKANLNYKQLRDLGIYKQIEQIPEELKPYYEMIQKRFTHYKSFESLISFDEIIKLTHSMIEKDLLNDALCANLINVYYLYIDECQDLSNQQWEIINYIINEIIQIHELEVILVGDKMQSIYSFQGANPRSFDVFQEVHQSIHETHRSQGFTKQNMSHSYRCGTNVTKLVNAIFNLDQVSRSDTQDSIEFWESSDDWQDRICDKIEFLLQTKAPSNSKHPSNNNKDTSISVKTNSTILPGDILILIRKRNAKYLELADKLAKKGIPVVYDEHKTVCKKILSILKQISSKMTAKIKKEDYILSQEQFSHLFKITHTPIILIKYILEIIGINQKMQSSILYGLTNYLTSQGNSLHSCILFFEQIPSIETHQSNAVRIQTVHATKGQEAKIIFLCDTMQNPNFSSLDIDIGDSRDDIKNEALEEYKRLLYVALTRAKEKLILVNNQESYKLSKDSWYKLLSDGIAKIQQLNE